MSAVADAETIAASRPLLADGVEVLPQDEGHVHLRGPSLRRSGFGRGLAWLLRLPNRVEVALDEIGTFVVGHMDGRSLEELSTRLAERYQLTRRESDAALTAFIQSLLQRRLARLEGLFGNAA